MCGSVFRRRQGAPVNPPKWTRKSSPVVLTFIGVKAPASEPTRLPRRPRVVQLLVNNSWCFTCWLTERKSIRQGGPPGFAAVLGGETGYLWPIGFAVQGTKDWSDPTKGIMSGPAFPPQRARRCWASTAARADDAVRHTLRASSAAVFSAFERALARHRSEPGSSTHVRHDRFSR